MNFLNKFTEPAYALLRIVTGYLFLQHGTQKFLGFPQAFGMEMNTMLTVGGIIELVGGTLVMIGLFTRPAAFICSGTMAVAYWMFHAPNGGAIFPMLNGGELAVMFTFAFLYIACRGAGTWSIDSARS